MNTLWKYQSLKQCFPFKYDIGRTLNHPHDNQWKIILVFSVLHNNVWLKFLNFVFQVFTKLQWAMDVRQLIERLVQFMKRCHQCTEALKSDSPIFFSFASDLAFKRISVVETAIPALHFPSIHWVNSFSNSGNFGEQSWAALWSCRCSFKTAWFCLYLRMFFLSTWYWYAAARFPFSKAHVTTVSLKHDVYDILVDPFGFMVSFKWVGIRETNIISGISLACFYSFKSITFQLPWLYTRVYLCIAVNEPPYG